MRDYRGRFQAMVDELVRHPRVRVTHLWLGAGVSEAEIRRVEAALGYALDDSIRDFYRGCDGMQLRWLDTSNPAYVPERDDRLHVAYEGMLEHDDVEADGLIHILPMGECFVDFDYDGQLYDASDERGRPEELGGRSYSRLDFRRALRPVDNFSPESRAAFFLADRRSNPLIVVGEDHDACFDSYLLDFRSYMELLLQCRGHLDKRRSVVFGRGPRNQIVTIPRGEPAPIEGFLSKRPLVDPGSAVGSRVSARSGRYQDRVRGVIVQTLEAQVVPRDWLFGRSLYRVRLDLGDELLVPCSAATAVTELDAYERAVNNGGAFFGELFSRAPAERFDVLAEVLARETGSSRHEGSALAVESGALRYVAMMGALSPADAAAVLLTLLEGFTQEEAAQDTPRPLPSRHYDEEAPPLGSTSAYRVLVRQLLCALAIVVCRAHEAAPFSRIAEGLGRAAALRLEALLPRLDREHYGWSDKLPPPGPNERFRAIEFLRASLSAVPGRLVLPSAGLRGGALGLSDLPISQG